MKVMLITAWIIGAIGIPPAQASKNSDPMSGASKDECVFVRDITGWRVLDSRNVVLFTGAGRRAYLAQLSPPASDLEHAFKVAFIDRDRDGQLCGRSPDKLQAMGSLVEQPANIMGMTRLDDAGLQRLETQFDVKLTRKNREATEQPRDEMNRPRE
jgi:hypothetical protein